MSRGYALGVMDRAGLITLSEARANAIAMPLRFVPQSPRIVASALQVTAPPGYLYVLS